MKTIATLALIMALLGFPAVNANADTFTLWENFPQYINGIDGFGTAGVALSNMLLTPLDNTDPYSFSRAGVVVARLDTVNPPYIFMQPSSTETAVYYGIPPETVTINVSFQFDLVPGATSAHVDVGTADITDFSHPVYTSLFGYDLNSIHPTVTYNLLNVVVDPTLALVFAVDQGVGDAQAYLQGTITTVPVPGSLLLLGSGLLGLAGWRRRPWSK